MLAIYWIDFGFKNPVPQFFGFDEFRTFAVLRLFLYGDYVRVKRIGANPLYNLPRRRLRKLFVIVCFSVGLRS